MYTVEDIDGVLKDGMLCCENCAFFFLEVWLLFENTNAGAYFYVVQSPSIVCNCVFSQLSAWL